MHRRQLGVGFAFDVRTLVLRTARRRGLYSLALRGFCYLLPSTHSFANHSHDMSSSRIPVSPPPIPPLALPGRDPRLPALYCLEHHPQLAATPGVHNIYLYMANTDIPATLEDYKFLAGMEFPRGTEDGVSAAGE